MDTLINNFFNWEVLSEVWPFLLSGLLVTCELALITLGTSMILGLVAALLKISRIKVVSSIVSGYINLFRGTPLLVQIIIIFYALPSLGINLARFPAGIVALTLNNGAYVAEILRGGIESIPKGQKEAAQSLGLNYFQCMYKVILPQAFKNSLPALTNSFVALLKDTSLVSVIGVTELLKEGRQLQTWKANSTPLIGVAALYFLVIWPFIMLVEKLEKRLKKT